MAYGIKYYSDFDSFKANLTFRLYIKKKDYSGDQYNILLSGTPVIHEWQDDDPQKTIKGSTLKIGILNNGVVSLDDFYSNEDDTFLVELYRKETDELLFIGYIIQDECAEIQLDFLHEINITASDGLGLLKDTNFLDASIKYPKLIEYNGIEIFSYSDIYGNKIWAALPEEYLISTNNTLVISGGSALDGTYTIDHVNIDTPGFYTFYVNESIPTLTSFTGNLSYYRAIDLSKLLSYGEIMRLCLLSTGFELATNVMSKLYPIHSSETIWIDSTFIFGTTFFESEWMNCYDILDKIMNRFNSTLFQSHGQWYVIRWGELWFNLDYDSISFDGYRYNSEFTSIVNVNYTDSIHYFPSSLNEIETGTIKSIFRPYQYIKETFNYDMQSNLCYNSNLDKLGALLNNYNTGQDRDIERYVSGPVEGFTIQGDLINFKRDQTFIISGSGGADGTYKVLDVVNASGSFIVKVEGTVPLFSPNNATIYYLTVFEYDPLGYHPFIGPFFPSAGKYTIDVVKDFQGNEIERYLNVNPNGGPQNKILSSDIQITKGDIIHITMDYKTKNSYTAPSPYGAPFQWHLKLTDGTVDYLISSEIFIWFDPVLYPSYNQYTIAVMAGDNTSDWHQMDVQSEPAPIDGIFTIGYIGQYANGLHFKNITIEITNSISGQTKVIGQTHTNSQDFVLKNNIDKDIDFDDTISSSIKGTQFLSTSSGILRDKTTLWNYLGRGEEYDTRLGELTTFEQLYLFYKPRTKLEMNLLKIFENDLMLALNTVLLYGNTIPEQYRYIIGSLSIDYKNGTANCTAYGLIDGNDSISNLESINLYEFNYLYENN